MHHPIYEPSPRSQTMLVQAVPLLEALHLTGKTCTAEMPPSDEAYSGASVTIRNDNLYLAERDWEVLVGDNAPVHITLLNDEIGVKIREKTGKRRATYQEIEEVAHVLAYMNQQWQLASQSLSFESPRKQRLTGKLRGWIGKAVLHRHGPRTV